MASEISAHCTLWNFNSAFKTFRLTPNRFELQRTGEKRFGCGQLCRIERNEEQSLQNLSRVSFGKLEIDLVERHDLQISQRGAFQSALLLLATRDAHSALRRTFSGESDDDSNSRINA